VSYYFNKILHTSFDDAVARVVTELEKEGFGVLTERVTLPLPIGLYSWKTNRRDVTL
jgi:hypothetical protein